MTSDDRCTLMISDDLQRYFLVPDDVELPFGELSVRTVMGHRRFVDEKAIAAHEVPREKADARMKAKVEAFFASLRDFVTREEHEAPPKPLTPELQRDARALIAGLREVMSGVRKTIEEERAKKS